MNYTLLCAGEHPRLEFTQKEVESLRARLREDDSLRATWEEWSKEGDALLETQWLTQEYADSVYSQHGRYYEVGGQLIRLAEHLGLLYCMTKKKEYAHKLRDAMLHYARFAVWTGPSNKDRDTPWTSDLSTTNILYAYALAYDCIYETLTEEERGCIRAAMLQKGIRPLLNDWVLPGTRVHALDSMGHNWWAVCVAFAGIGLCALYEDVPEANEWMGQVLGALHGFCTYSGSLLLNKTSNFDEKGLFYESPNYFNYGVGELLRFAFVFSRLFADGRALTRFAHVDKVPQALLSMSYPTGNPADPLLFPNFGDGNLSGNLVTLPRFGLLYGLPSDELRYAYRAYQKKPDFLDFLYPALSKAGSLNALPKNAVFEHSGYAYLRTGWQPDETLLAVRCGYTWNHAHDDAGHFMLFADGAPVVTDCGNCAYELPEYGEFYKTCNAHNVVTIDGGTQRADAIVRGSKFPGTLSHFVDGEIKYLLADVTGPTCDRCNRNYRSFLWLCPDLLVVVDELRAHAPAQFASLVHFAGEGTASGNALYAAGKTPLGVQVLFPENVRAEMREGYVPPTDHRGTNPDAKRDLPRKDYAAFVAGEKTDVMQFVTLYGLHGAARAQAQRLGGPNWLGVKVEWDGSTYEVAYNLLADGRKMHENSNNTVLGYETDAYLLAFKTDPAGRRSVLMVYGSYLRRAGRSLYESFTKDFTQFAL